MQMQATPVQQSAMPTTAVRSDNDPRWVEATRRRWVYAAVAVAVDVLAAAGAVALALWFGEDSAIQHQAAGYAWLFIPFLVLVLSSRGMYRRRLNRSVIDELEPVETSTALAALATLAVMLTFTGSTRPGEIAVRIWLCAAVLIPIVRLVRALVERHLRRRYKSGARTLIVGTDPVALQLVTRLQQVPDYGLRPIGMVDERVTAVTRDELDYMHVPYLGSPEQLQKIVDDTGAEELIVAISSASDDELARTAHMAHQLGMQVRVVPRLMDAMGVGARVEHVGGLPLLVLSYADPSGWQFAVKHATDRLLAGFGLLLISPLFLGLMLAVKLSSPGPIFFGQQRVGRNGKVFSCLKFRSMRPERASDAAFQLGTGSAPGGVEGVDRRTKIGKLMRKTSLDELPQLLNVVKGDMSLVGPRPERPEFVELFEIQIRRYGERHRVKAGMTGWAQVHGLRGQTSIADRAEFDNYYIENWSLALDFKILLLTILAVLRPSED
jgi:exopolysaccharide biosynthesis polyprenyl glycosylphosphotransferase